MAINSRSLNKTLTFTELNKAKITIDNELRLLMLLLFNRKRITGPKRLYSYYERAFDDYLFENKIPKIVRKITRKQFKLECSPKVKKQLKDLELIARKRQQPLAVIIEEAIRRFLDKPENYLGKDEYPSQKFEKVVTN